MKLDTQSKLSSNTVTLHWIVAIMMIGLLSTGLYMESTETFGLYPWHKSFGVLIILFVVLRILWRIKNGWPTPIRDYRKVEKILSKVVHYLLIIGTLLMPLSGFMMSSMGGHGVAFFGLELFARNPDPMNPQKNNNYIKILIIGISGALGALSRYFLGNLINPIVDYDFFLDILAGCKKID